MILRGTGSHYVALCAAVAWHVSVLMVAARTVPSRVTGALIGRGIPLSHWETAMTLGRPAAGPIIAEPTVATSPEVVQPRYKGLRFGVPLGACGARSRVPNSGQPGDPLAAGISCCR